VNEKPHPRTYRATDPEYAEIQRRAEEAGLAIAEYVRRRALGRRIPQSERNKARHGRGNADATST
jgi:hypothetical protein